MVNVRHNVVKADLDQMSHEHPQNCNAEACVEARAHWHNVGSLRAIATWCDETHTSGAKRASCSSEKGDRPTFSFSFSDACRTQGLCLQSMPPAFAFAQPSARLCAQDRHMQRGGFNPARAFAFLPAHD